MQLLTIIATLFMMVMVWGALFFLALLILKMVLYRKVKKTLKDSFKEDVEEQEGVLYDGEWYEYSEDPGLACRMN